MVRRSGCRYLAPMMVLCLLSSIAFAQRPDVAGEARAWLSTVDEGHYSESWVQAGSYFQDAISQAEWVAALSRVRAPLGAPIARRITASTPHGSLPNAPDGDYTIVLFESQFEHLDTAKETVTLVNEAGDWRVVGYFIAPGH